MKVLLPLLVSLFLSVTYNSLFAQELKCGTIAPPIEKVRAIEQKLQETQRRTAIEYSIVYIPIKPWIIRKSDGTGWLTEKGVMRGISAANEYFIKAGFQFYICDGFGYINDDKFYDLKNEDDNLLPFKSNVINIYYPFSATLGGSPVGGYTYQPPSLNNKVCVIYHHADNERTVAHELGHYFNLFHTNEFGNELVNGSNCSIAGDMVCDTKADPGGLPGYSASECAYTGTSVDANGDAYVDPPMYNAMGYLYCGSYFTEGQYERMRNAYNAFLTSLSCNAASPVSPTNLTAELSGYNIILNWKDNATTEIGYMIERYDAATAAFYSVGITEANETSFTDYFAPANQPVRYRVKPINSASAFSNVADINSSLSYCRPHYANKECSPAIYMADFSLFKDGGALLENLSDGCPGDNHSDFTAKIVRLNPGATYNFRIRFGLNPDNTYQKQYTGIFIDLNQDGDFDDPGELVYQGDESTPYILQGSFALPATAKNGFTRMRIRTQDFWSDYKVKDACERREWGEVEDYTVEVSSPLSPNLVFDIIPAQTFGDPPVPLSATSNSNLPVTYVVVSGPGTIKGDSLMITGAGKIVVKAIQEGDNNYAPASVEQTIVVAKANQTITIDLIPAQTFGDPPVPLSATSNSNLPVTYTVVSGPGTIKDGSLVITGAGKIVVKAVQEGNNNYAPASAEQTIVVAKANQVIAIDSIPAQTFGNPPVPLSTTSNSNLPVTYTVVSGPGTIKGNSLVITGAGEIVVKAVQAGNSNYTSATDEQTILVNKALQTLTFDSIPSQPYTREPVILSGSSSSGLPVIYTVVSGPATVTGNSLLMTGTGTVVVQATQPGDNNYVAADTVQRTFCITASQPAAINGDTLSCTGKSTYFINPKWGTRYQWAVSENASVKVLSDTSVEISYTRPGYYSITATPGNTCSSPANALTVHIKEGPAKPVITVVNDSLLSSGAETGNQWFINGSIIPGGTRQQYAPLQAGDYTVQVNVDGCTSPVSEPYHFMGTDLPPASDTSLLEDAVKLYPNPFDHTLKVLNKRNTPIGLRLYDITGRVVLYKEIRPGIQEISTGYLQRGIYIALLINLKEGTWAARKMLLKL